MNESEPYQFERSKGYLTQENQTPTNQERSSNRSIRSQSSERQKIGYHNPKRSRKNSVEISPKDPYERYKYSNRFQNPNSSSGNISNNTSNLGMSFSGSNERSSSGIGKTIGAGELYNEIVQNRKEPILPNSQKYKTNTVNTLLHMHANPYHPQSAKPTSITEHLNSSHDSNMQKRIGLSHQIQQREEVSSDLPDIHEVLHNFKKQKERLSPPSFIKREAKDLGKEEIKWLTELKISSIADSDKINLYETEILNLIDENNELKSKAFNSETKLIKITTQMQKKNEWIRELKEIQTNINSLQQIASKTGSPPHNTQLQLTRSKIQNTIEKLEKPTPSEQEREATKEQEREREGDKSTQIMTPKSRGMNIGIISNSKRANNRDMDMDIDLQNDRITQIQFDTQNQNNNLSFLKDKMGIMKEEETEFDKFIKYLYEQYQQKKGISDTTSNLMSFIDPHTGLRISAIPSDQNQRENLLIHKSPNLATQISKNAPQFQSRNYADPQESSNIFKEASMFSNANPLEKNSRDFKVQKEISEIQSEKKVLKENNIFLAKENTDIKKKYDQILTGYSDLLEQGRLRRSHEISSLDHSKYIDKYTKPERDKIDQSFLSQNKYEISPHTSLRYQQENNVKTNQFISEMDLSEIDAEQSNDVGYLQNKVNILRQYCIELCKVNRILDLENRMAIGQILKLQKKRIKSNDTVNTSGEGLSNISNISNSHFLCPFNHSLDRQNKIRKKSTPNLKPPQIP